MQEPYYSNGNQEIYCGDSLEVLKDIPSESVDLVLTDPPYAMISGEYGKDSAKGGFMGKEWDAELPRIEMWEECLRVLKPGALLFCMSAPRADLLANMILRIQKAGFSVRFSPVYYAFASGFPKALNISKAVDKRKGAVRKGAVRKGAGTKGNTFPLEQEYETGEPITDEAKKLDGSYGGMQLKPAVEIVVVAMKPLQRGCKTYTDQALKNRKGITWLDDGRIPFVSSQDKESAAAARAQQQARVNKETHQTVSLILEDSRVGKSPEGEYERYLQSKGRFPANILVEDDVLNDGRTHKGSGGGGLNAKDDEGVTWRIAKKGYQSVHQYSDDGGFSRYFDLGAWWTERIKHLPESVQLTFPFLIVPKPSKREKDKGLEAMPVSSDRDKAALSAAEHGVPQQRNPHPTVKALKLMSWLITIGSREGDVVLDPFVGSGTTAIAAKLLKRLCIGIDITPEYCEVARKRLEAWNE